MMEESRVVHITNSYWNFRHIPVQQTFFVTIISVYEFLVARLHTAGIGMR